MVTLPRPPRSSSSSTKRASARASARTRARAPRPRPFFRRERTRSRVGFWKRQGFRAAGDPDTLTAQKKKDYGYGAPKWSPYYRRSDKVMSQEAKERSAKALGDQAWWEQYGFKGAISEDKKRDYGNGVPRWSPRVPPASFFSAGSGAARRYHRADEPKAGEEREKTNLPADAFWFQQWGFRTGEISEEKRRDYGYGVPMWSPYYRSTRGPPTPGLSPVRRATSAK